MATATQQQVRRAIEQSNATGTAAEVLATITAPSVEKTNSELLTLRTVAVTYGPVVAATAAGVLKAAGQLNPLCDGIYISVCSTGINFADPLTQAMIDQIFTGEHADVGTALKALGRWLESPLEVAGKQRGLTTDEATVQAVLNEQATLAKWRPFVVDVENGLATGTITSWADVIALAEARL